jgi:hypothetical protein
LIWQGSIGGGKNLKFDEYCYFWARKNPDRVPGSIFLALQWVKMGIIYPRYVDPNGLQRSCRMIYLKILTCLKPLLRHELPWMTSFGLPNRAH